MEGLEDSLGKQLFIRGNRQITLTKDGMLLRKRAEEITYNDKLIAGDIYIGAGETKTIHLIALVAKKIQQSHPNIHIHIISGDTQYVTEQLDKGLIDFGLIFETTNLANYNYKHLNYHDTWGVLMKKDAPLATKTKITPKDLWQVPLILSRQVKAGDALTLWLQKNLSELNVVATYNLLYNGSILVDEGVGYALCLDKIINTTGKSNLCFRPLEPNLTANLNIIWKKYQVLSDASELFLNTLLAQIES